MYKLILFLLFFSPFFIYGQSFSWTEKNEDEKTAKLTDKTLTITEIKGNPKKEKQIIFGPKFPVFATCGACIRGKQVVYFPSEMYKKGVLKKIEFSFYSDNLFPDKGDTIREKLPVMLKIYARNIEKNIPGEELLKDTIILIPQKRHKKMQIDISEYGIVLPPDGIYCGFEAFSTEWYIAHGYFTLETISYKTKSDNPMDVVFNTPMLEYTANKKDVERYETYAIGGHLSEWKKVTYINSTLIVRLHISQ